MCAFSSVFHVGWFTLLRFISLQWPHKFSSFVKKYAKVKEFEAHGLCTVLAVLKQDVIKRTESNER